VALLLFPVILVGVPSIAVTLSEDDAGFWARVSLLGALPVLCFVPHSIILWAKIAGIRAELRAICPTALPATASEPTPTGQSTYAWLLVLLLLLAAALVAAILYRGGDALDDSRVPDPDRGDWGGGVQAIPNGVPLSCTGKPQKERDAFRDAIRDRCERLLEMQIAFRNNSLERDKVANQREPTEKPSTEEMRLRAKTGEQARDLLEFTDKLIALLGPGETSPVVMEVLKDIRFDLRRVQERLEEYYVGVIGVTRQYAAIILLEELIGVLKKGRNTIGKAEGENFQEPRLGIDEVSELQLLRALQVAVNKWTEILHRQTYDRPFSPAITDEIWQAHKMWVQGEFKDLAKRQDRISKLLREVAGRTPPARQF
jgi:hypothetical protein